MTTGSLGILVNITRLTSCANRILIVSADRFPAPGLDGFFMRDRGKVFFSEEKKQKGFSSLSWFYG
jgi:hypothetical protein